MSESVAVPLIEWEDHFCECPNPKQVDPLINIKMNCQAHVRVPLGSPERLCEYCRENCV